MIAALPPLVMAVLAIALLSAMDAIVKALSGGIGTWQIVWMRYAFGVAFSLAFAHREARAGIPRASLLPNLARGGLTVLTATSFFFALARLELVEAVTLAFTAPIWIVLIARVILGEPIRRRAVFAVVLGFAGVAVVYIAADTGPGAGRDTLGVLAALSAAFTLALALVLVRKRSAVDPVPTMVLLQNAAAVVLAAPMGVLTWTALDPIAWLGFGCIGLLGTLGHLLLSGAFARAPAGDLAPAEYTGLLWATLFGAIFFSEWPGPEHVIAATLIGSGCWIASRAERPDAYEASSRAAPRT